MLFNVPSIRGTSVLGFKLGTELQSCSDASSLVVSSERRDPAVVVVLSRLTVTVKRALLRRGIIG